MSSMCPRIGRDKSPIDTVFLRRMASHRHQFTKKVGDRPAEARPLSGWALFVGDGESTNILWHQVPHGTGPCT